MHRAGDSLGASPTSRSAGTIFPHLAPRRRLGSGASKSLYRYRILPTVLMRQTALPLRPPTVVFTERAIRAQDIGHAGIAACQPPPRQGWRDSFSSAMISRPFATQETSQP